MLKSNYNLEIYTRWKYPSNIKMVKDIFKQTKTENSSPADSSSRKKLISEKNKEMHKLMKSNEKDKYTGEFKWIINYKKQ